ncbi:phage protein Gp37 [Bilophila wadsworthia]|uniref:phage protein Gp37 n=1 Tax=Bilophila wadsworthia TaxID=35833 RepID=UPI003AABCE91
MSRTPMEVEDAILELLQPLRETPGAKTLAAFQGQPDKDTWARLRRGFPAVLVLYAGSPAFTPSGRRLEERMEFEVYVMDKSYRSAANGQKPEPGHPGTYALLAAVRERLLGVPPLPGMGPCLPSSIQGFVLDGASVYRMTVSTIHNIAL